MIKWLKKLVKGSDFVVTKKKISVIALDPRAGKSYGEDIAGLFSDVADISVFSMLDGSAAGVLERADLFVASTDAYGSPEELAKHIPLDSQTMAIEVSFRWSELRKLKELPAGSKVLFVNMTETMAREAIAQLEQFGITHIHWIPFYPGASLEEDVHIAVTPDEMRYVPPKVETVIDIGQRVCTSGMMIEIALRLGLESLLEGPAFQEYARSVATSNYSFDQMFARSVRLESLFHILLESLEDGVIGINEKGEIFACSRQAEDMTCVSAALIQGKRCEEVFPYIPFAACLRARQTLPAKVIKVNSVNLSVEVPVIRQNACIGAFALLQRFNDVEVRQNELRGQLLHKGYYAKYSFDDVIGQSAAIRRTKETLTRMANSESPILLIGETGTGKELFAHAVHQASRRAAGPFLAINVAAFPENLLESELFGYEEGAFTGAKKGGRPGLFELAHRGTLFLDEVEGMSPALQIKLLRTLQEREVMRVGGNRIIHVDVRIVAATNEALERKVRDGTFRRDLLLPVEHPAGGHPAPDGAGGRYVSADGAVPPGAERRLPPDGAGAELFPPSHMARQYPGAAERGGILHLYRPPGHHHGGPPPHPAALRGRPLPSGVRPDGAAGRAGPLHVGFLPVRTRPAVRGLRGRDAHGPGQAAAKGPGVPCSPLSAGGPDHPLRNGGAGAGPGQPRPGRQPADAQGPGAVGNRSKMKSYNHLYQFDQ